MTDGSDQQPARMGVAVGDFLHTGFPGLAIPIFSDDYTPLFRNDGKWTFEDIGYQSGIGLPSLPWVKWGDAFVDLDNDGWLDLITVTGHVYPQVDTLPSGSSPGYRGPKLLQMNQHDGTFCDASDAAGSALQLRQVSRGLAVGDLFNDGNMDIVVENLEGKPMILRNRGIAGQHWVSFELAGTKSNRLAIGSQLKIIAGGITQTKEIHSGGSYLSQNDLRVHFGLGTPTRVDKLEVRWPSGAVDVIKDLMADQFYGVLEGKGLVSLDQVRPQR